MIWVTWRQYRVQFLAGLGASALLAGYLLFLGYSIRHSYNTDVLGCMAADGCVRGDAQTRFFEKFSDQVELASVLLYALPLLLGMFWGAPLIARELETNTHRLAWNQSVTRTRWLAVKLAFVLLVGAALAGALSGLLTWAASRFDQLEETRFGVVSFASRNVTPIGYVVFAVILGAVVGLFLRKAIPAMVVTLAVLGVLAVLVPSVVRPHWQPPVRESVAYATALKGEDSGGMSFSNDDNQPVMIPEYTVAGALMLTAEVPLRFASGTIVHRKDIEDCVALIGPPTGKRPNGTTPFEACLLKRDVHFDIAYQPADRYWTFQWLELAAFLTLSVLLAGVAFVRIRHVRG